MPAGDFSERIKGPTDKYTLALEEVKKRVPIGNLSSRCNKCGKTNYSSITACQYCSSQELDEGIVVGLPDYFEHRYWQHFISPHRPTRQEQAKLAEVWLHSLPWSIDYEGWRDYTKEFRSIVTDSLKRGESLQDWRRALRTYRKDHQGFIDNKEYFERFKSSVSASKETLAGMRAEVTEKDFEAIDFLEKVRSELEVSLSALITAFEDYEHILFEELKSEDEFFKFLQHFPLKIGLSPYGLAGELRISVFPAFYCDYEFGRDDKPAIKAYFDSTFDVNGYFETYRFGIIKLLQRALDEAIRKDSQTFDRIINSMRELRAKLVDEGDCVQPLQHQDGWVGGAGKFSNNLEIHINILPLFNTRGLLGGGHKLNMNNIEQQVNKKAGQYAQGFLKAFRDYAKTLQVSKT